MQYQENRITFDFFIREYKSRSLMTMTIAWNSILGKSNPYGYHLFNLTFHLFNSLLLFFITGNAGRRFQLYRMSVTGKEIQALSLFAAFLFMIHPLQTESVIDIMGRSEVLAATFYLGGFLLFQNALDGKSAPLVRYTVIPLAILVLAILGFGVKQTLITLPAVMMLYYLCGCAPESLPIRTLKKGKWFFILIAGAGFSLLLRKLLSDETFLIGPAPVEKMAGRKIYMLTQPPVLMFYYLKLILFPVNLSIDPDILLVDQWLSPRFLSAFLLITFAMYLAVVAKRSRIWFFFVGWFFIIISPSSSIITLQDLAAEHRVYLASYGVYLLLALGLLLMLFEDRAECIMRGNSRPNARLLGYIALIVITLLLCGITIKRNAVWNSELTLWDDARKKAPAKVRPLANLARAYSLGDDNDRAMALYEQSIARNSSLFESHYNLGDLYYKSGRVEDGLNHILIAAALEPRIAEIQARLGEIYMDRKQYELADAHFRNALELNSQYVIALHNLAVVNYYYLKDKKHEALLYFARSLELDPNQKDARLIRRLLEQQNQ
ncbi:MAG: hypothetical protein A3K09_03995 [Nitrospinae bacterium RIFCSPLOWO2_12_FULL_47_7]|nr:MAG: hypothetical protein A3K09_03995 [Nitrospinae bacterium RIFCSPLOWO2_12_FULL_47_7]